MFSSVTDSDTSTVSRRVMCHYGGCHRERLVLSCHCHVAVGEEIEAFGRRQSVKDVSDCHHVVFSESGDTQLIREMLTQHCL